MACTPLLAAFRILYAIYSMNPNHELGGCDGSGGDEPSQPTASRMGLQVIPHFVLEPSSVAPFILFLMFFPSKICV